MFNFFSKKLAQVPEVQTLLVDRAMLERVLINEQITKLKQEHAEQLRQQAAENERRQMQRFGFQAKEVEAELHIQNFDGDCVFFRTYQGVSVSQIILPHILHKVMVTEPGSLDGDPILKMAKCGPGKGLRLKFDGQEMDNHRLKREFRVMIDGNLTENDSPLDYQYEVKVKKGFAMHAEEMQLRKRSREPGEPEGEYFAFDVEYPVQQLRLIVRFPENYPVSVGFSAFLVRGWVLLDHEYQRIHGGFRHQANQATITIEKPLHGYRYVVHWQPPPKSVNRNA